MEKSMYMNEDKLMEAFSIVDRDGNGKFTIDELKDVMGGMKSNSQQSNINKVIVMIKAIMSK